MSDVTIVSKVCIVIMEFKLGLGRVWPVCQGKKSGGGVKSEAVMKKALGAEKKQQKMHNQIV